LGRGAPAAGGRLRQHALYQTEEVTCPRTGWFRALPRLILGRVSVCERNGFGVGDLRVRETGYFRLANVLSGRARAHPGYFSSCSAISPSTRLGCGCVTGIALIETSRSPSWTHDADGCVPASTLPTPDDIPSG
jgi:hypothetical protein